MHPSQNCPLFLPREAGFESTEIIGQDDEDVYPDEDSWWKYLISTKDFGLIEPLEDKVIERIKTEAFEKFQEF